MKYAFINEAGFVVQVITGSLTQKQQEQFLDDYHMIFGAIAILEVPEGADIWMGGMYTSDQGFLPPPQPEPELLPEPDVTVEQP